MLQPLLMVCFVAVFLRDAFGEPWLYRWLTPGQGAALSLAIMVSIALVTHILIWRCGRRLSRTGDGRQVRRADLTVGAAWLAAAVAHVFNVLALGWLDAVRALVGNAVVVDEALAVLPVLAVIVLAWWSLFPIDRRVREAGLIRDLDDGAPVYRQMSRADFVLMAVRHQLAIVMVPIFLVMGWSELVLWAAERWFEFDPGAAGAAGDGTAWAILAMQAAGALGVFTLMPPLMRRVWDTEPLGPGAMRVRLDELCRRHGVRNRELLVWRTRGTMINGAVMGLFAPVRYIMLTDALLDHLTDSQVEAVMAHEVGHVRRRHMLWLAVAMSAALAGVVAAASLALSLLPLPRVVVAWADVPVTVTSLTAAMLLFGFASRRFEWQADAFAVQHLTRYPSDAQEVPPTPGARITAEAVAAMSGALQAVADLNHVPPDRFSWRHGSILTRQRRLVALIGLPLDRLPIDRQARTVKRLSALVLLAAGALAAAQSLLPGTMDGEVRQNARDRQ